MKLLLTENQLNLMFNEIHNLELESEHHKKIKEYVTLLDYYYGANDGMEYEMLYDLYGDKSSLNIKYIINSLKELGVDYIPKDKRLKKINKIQQSIENYKTTYITEKGFKFNIAFKPQEKIEIPDLYMTITDENNQKVGFIVLSISLAHKILLIDSAIVYNEFKRQGIYSTIIKNFILPLAKKLDLQITYQSRTDSANSVWKNIKI